MSCMKRYAEQVSIEMGFDGEITDEVLEEGARRLLSAGVAKCGGYELNLKHKPEWKLSPDEKTYRIKELGISCSSRGGKKSQDRELVRLFLILNVKAAHDALNNNERKKWEKLVDLVDVDAFDEQFRTPPRVAAQLLQEDGGRRFVRFSTGEEPDVSPHAMSRLVFLDPEEWFEADMVYSDNGSVVLFERVLPRPKTTSSSSFVTTMFSQDI